MGSVIVGPQFSAAHDGAVDFENRKAQASAKMLRDIYFIHRCDCNLHPSLLEFCDTALFTVRFELSAIAGRGFRAKRNCP
jgi:hypothetical protein